MSSRHRAHLTSYLSAHKAGKPGNISSKADNNTETVSATSQTKDVPVLFTSSARSQAACLKTRKQSLVKITGNATINHLPDELLLKIFSFLDAGNLLMAGRVCRRWLPLAKDNLLWDKIFMKYSSQLENTTARQSGDLGEGNPVHSRKNQFIKSIATARNKKALRLLKKISPFTGLAKDTDKILKTAGVYFQLTFIDLDQNEHTLNSKDVFYHQMGVSPRWYDLDMPKVKSIKEIQIHAVNPLFFHNGRAVWNSPYQRSLLLSQPLDWNKWLRTNKPTGSDDMVNLYTLPDGLMFGTWKGDGELAFVSVGLHSNQLVKKCFFGSSETPYDIGTHKVVSDDIDSSYGLHDYSCTVEIRTLRNSIWSQQFTCLSCRKENIGSGYAVFPLIRKDYHSDHVILQKNLQFPWKTDAFRGIVENVVWIDVTVLDERSEPFWCISSLTKVAEESLQKNFDFDYSSDDSYVLMFMDERGKLEAQMSKTDDGNFFMTVLNLKLSLDAVNTWFGTSYK